MLRHTSFLAWNFSAPIRDDDRNLPRGRQKATSGNAITASDISRPGAVERIRAGDRVAFDELYLAYVEPLASFAYRYVRSVEGAEDIVHDVFLSVWANHAKWDPADVSAYLFRSVLNRALQVGRHAGVLARAADTLDDDSTLMGTTLPAPDAAVETNSEHERLARLLATLPERARIAIRLRWYDDLSYTQIAQVLDISEDAARMYVSRALKLLRATGG